MSAGYLNAGGQTRVSIAEKARVDLRDDAAGALEGARITEADIADFQDKVRAEMRKPASE